MVGQLVQEIMDGVAKPVRLGLELGDRIPQPV